MTHVFGFYNFDLIEMIHKLLSNDNAELMEFLEHDRDYNLFIIGDIENYGFDTDFLDVWSNIHEGRMTSVLLRYHSYFIFYTPFPKNEDVTGFAEIVKNSKDAETLSGMAECVELFEPHLGFKDIIRLNIINSIKICGRMYVIERERKIVSCAGTTAETGMSAVIISVMTHPDFRRRGYASQCVMKVCNEVLEEGKSVFIIYENPHAGRIYKKVGFENIGRWCVGVLKGRR